MLVLLIDPCIANDRCNQTPTHSGGAIGSEAAPWAAGIYMANPGADGQAGCSVLPSRCWMVGG